MTRYDLTEDCATGEVDITPVPETQAGSYVAYEDYAALEARCAALAAENAGLKSIQAWAVADVFKSGAKRFESTKTAGFDTDDCLHDAVLVMLSELKTPATDAFLAEVRAQGVDVARNVMIDFVDGEVGPNENVPGLIRSAEICVSIAANLRKGAI
ncbi:hypothetical protein KSS88_18370 [Bacillus altitudinis]|nr:hypothetical protein [Bacillus altitudinis]MBU8970812.1 hypothetical protein [Bacillus altitudinis]